MNADGTGLTAITKNTGNAMDSVQPVFSTDSPPTTVYFASNMGSATTTSNWNASALRSKNLWRAAVNGSSLARITNETSGFATRDCTHPAISPDGATLAYQAFSRVSGSTPASSNLAVISSTASATSGTLLTQNTSANLDSAEPSFSPDGSAIVFSSRTDPACTGDCASWDGAPSASANLWVVTGWSGTPSFAPLTFNDTVSGLDSVSPTFSPDGSRIVFSSRTQLNGAWNGTTTYSNNIWVVDADGSDLTPLTQNSSIGGGLDSGLAPSGVWYVAP
jgi:Tol biopolymer transport system component